MPREHSAGLANLLALVVFNVGLWPARTLVAVGEVDRDGCMVLFDLPEDGDIGSWLTLTTTLGHRLRVQQQSRAMLFLFGDADPGPGPSDAARQGLSGVAQSLARDHGIAVGDCCLVGPTAYRSLLCDEDCCPPGGDPRQAAEVSQVARVLDDAARGEGPTHDVEQFLATFAPAEAADRLTPQDLDRARRQVTGHELTWVDNWRTWIAGAHPAGPAGPAGSPGLQLQRGELAGLVTALGLPGMLPEMLLTAVADPALTLADYAHLTDGTAQGAAAKAPDTDRVARALHLLRAAAVAAPDASGRAGALAAAGWVLWYGGDPVRGRAVVLRALQEVPGHRRAARTEQLIGSGDLPPWHHASRPMPTAATAWATPRSTPAPAAPMRAFFRYAGYAISAVCIVGWVLRLLGS